MSQRAVGLITRDPILYAELAQVVRERHLPAVSLLPGDRIPTRVAVVLTSEAEAPSIDHPRVIGLREGAEPAALWAAVNAGLRPAGREGEIIVGIDPGPRPGFAVVLTGDCLARGTLDAPEDVPRLVHQLRRLFPARSVRVRVGNGAPLHRDRILRALPPRDPPVELVNERGTTPRGRRHSGDGLAAVAIAECSGRPVRGRPDLAPTDGEVADVQRLSREGSGGQFTISRLQARRVLRGEITFGEAIDEGAHRNSPTRPRNDRNLAPREHS